MKNLSLTREQQPPDTNEHPIRSHSAEAIVLIPPTRSHSTSPSSSRSNESASPNNQRTNLIDATNHHHDHIAHTMLNLSENEQLDCKRLAYDAAEEHSPSTQGGDSSAKEEENESEMMKKRKTEQNSAVRHSDRECMIVMNDDKDPSNWPSSENCSNHTVELRLLVRRREAGALIGKRGSNIKRLRETFRSSIFSIPDTGNGPERVVCIASHESFIQPILTDVTHLLMEKSPEKDEQIELKLLIHSSQAGSIIGIGGQSIKRLRNDSKAAIKIYELCCPYSNERVCAVKAKPPVVVSTVKMILAVLNENPIKGTIKPYDALHFDLSSVDKYGGYLPEDGLDFLGNQYDLTHTYNRQVHDSSYLPTKHYPVWRAAQDYEESPCDIQHEAASGAIQSRTPDRSAPHLHHHHHQQQMMNEMTSTQLSSSNHPEMTQNSIRPKENNISDDCKQVRDSPEDLKMTQFNSYQAYRNLARFHPYSQQPNQMDFSAYRLSLQRPFPSSAYPTRFSFIGPPHPYPPHPHYSHHQQYVRMQTIFPSSTERCRHTDRQCICMFMPMFPNGPVSRPVPYIRVPVNGAQEHTGSYLRGNQSRSVHPKRK